MLERFLFIGMGGTGGTVLHHTWAQLDKWLRSRDYTGGMPEGWRFLHFDLPENPDVAKGDVPVLAGTAIKYVNLAVSPLTYGNYDTQLLQMAGSPEAVAGWRTDPERSMPFPYDGAGQLRSVGNLVSLATQMRVRAAIADARTQLQSETTTAELGRISRHLQLANPPVTPDPTVVLVSSLGGGSGSGMFLNVIEMLLAEASNSPWLRQRLYTVLFTPEALKDDGAPAAGDGMEANSLGALSEFLNAFHHRGPVDPLDGHLFRAGGGGVLEGPRVGRYNFFVGKTSGKRGFGGPGDVAKAIGKGLAVLAADDAVRATFQDYVGVNWRGQPIMPGFAIGDSGDLNHSATALGYASVSLGRDIFATYAAERLARHALDRLLRGQREYAQESTRRDERLIEDRADNAEAQFFAASGLHEHTELHNDVLERLCDKDGLRARITGALDAVRDAFSEDRREFTKAQAIDAISERFDDRAADVVAWAATDRYTRMRAWVSDMQRQLLEATAASIGTEGFAVTLELLNRLERQVREAADELEADAGKADKRLGAVTSRLEGIFTRVRDKIGARHESFKASIDDREGDLLDLVERDLFRFAAVHLRDVAEGLLPPLRRAVASAQSAIAQAEQGSDRKLIEQWSGQAVANHLRPARNELLLDPVDNFPAQLDELLMDLYDVPAGDAESEAVREVISGSWLSTTDDDEGTARQSLIVPGADWSPKTLRARPAQISLALSPSRLLAAAERWVRTRKGRVSAFVQEDIGAWLQTSERADADKRSAAFLAGLRSAIEFAAPLIAIGDDAFTAIHGGSQPAPTLAISKIPVGVGITSGGTPDTEAARRQEVELILTSAGVSRNVVGSLCDPNAKVGAVEVMTFLGSSVHPAVFTSVTQPILDRWERCTNPDQRRIFWEFRRTRQLSSFAPVSRQRQRALARGWLVANELGYVRRLQGAWSKSPLDIWSPQGRLPFPRALLGPEPYEHRDVFAALLETLPLAFLRLGRGAAAELNAYGRLLALGDLSGSTEAGRELEQWVRIGEFPVPDDGVTPHSQSAHTETDAAARAQAIHDRLLRARKSYDSVLAVRVTAASSLTVGRRWETREVFTGAVDDLIERVHALTRPVPPQEPEDY